jgi:Uma2 family endonuclease
MIEAYHCRRYHQAMAMGALISEQQYLRRTEKPNADYIDGVVLPKPWPTWGHSVCQDAVGALIHTRFPEFAAYIELTCKIRDGMYLVPDLAVERGRTEGPYPTKPVHLCVEIVSPENRFSALLRKCEQYHDWGVETAWIIDPEFRQAWEYRSGRRPLEIPADGALTAPGISISVADIFADG